MSDVFIKFFEEGIIYRANRLVNWDSTLTTALSNLEVDNHELTGRTLLNVPGYERKVEFGVIIHFKYQIENSTEMIEVATTRPETMLGDSGIAVHPDDTRYIHLIGKSAIHPFIKDRKVRIIADKIADRDFGSGAVKITPAHDPKDFEVGVTHGLEFINIFTDDGRVNENGGPYEGMKRFDVRYLIEEDLKTLGLFVEKRENPMTVPLSERTRDVVEPLMKPQWWVKMSSLAGDAVSPGIVIMYGESTYVLMWFRRLKLSKMGILRSDQSRRRGTTLTGWRTSTTGVFRGSCGGDISALFTTFASRARRGSRLMARGGSPDGLKMKASGPYSTSVKSNTDLSEARAKARTAWPDEKFELVSDHQMLFLPGLRRAMPSFAVVP